MLYCKSSQDVITKYCIILAERFLIEDNKQLQTIGIYILSCKRSALQFLS